MHKDVIEGKWKQMLGKARQGWGARRVADNSLDRVAGRYDKFIGLLQEKYGYTRERAEEEFNRRMAKHEAHPRQSGFRIRKGAG